MKTFILSIILLVSFFASSQAWCDAGATWKYSFVNGFGTEGYTEIQYVGDTIVNGQTAQQLNKHIYAYDYTSAQVVDFDLGQEYTYENNGVVYLWYNNNWDTLYNFDATVGESWRMAKQPLTNACDSNSVLTVIATGTKTINSMSLNYLVVDFGSLFGFSDTIVEKIGFISNYLLPYHNCDAALDIIEGGPFRCYEDNNFVTYQPHFTSNCDFIVRVNEMDSQPHFQIVPNPAGSAIELIGMSDDDEVKMYDLQGKEWFVSRQNHVVHLYDLPSGIYVLCVQNEYSVRYQRFVKE